MSIQTDFVLSFFYPLRFFKSYRVEEYARSGNIATETVELHEGPLTFAHSHTIEPQLRQLGLPTALVKGTAGKMLSSFLPKALLLPRGKPKQLAGRLKFDR